MEIFKKTPQIKFLKYKYIALIVTAVIILAGMVNIFVGRGLKLGVDFGEGTLIRVIFKDPTSVGDVRERLRAVGLENSQIQETNGKNGREFQIRAVEVQNTAAENQLESHAALGDKIIAALEDRRPERTPRIWPTSTRSTRRTWPPCSSPLFPNGEPALAEQILNARKSDENRGVFADVRRPVPRRRPGRRGGFPQRENPPRQA